jgi:hypothetical protein
VTATSADHRLGFSARLRSTLDARYWLTAILGTLVALLVLGVPTAVIPNPFFARMIATEPFNLVVWLAAAPLIGLLLATYVRPPGHGTAHQAESVVGRTTLGGVVAFLAIGCPICNKLVVAALGVSGALTIFAPLQPLIGAASVALLGLTLGWRLRERARACQRCAR